MNVAFFEYINCISEIKGKKRQKAFNTVEMKSSFLFLLFATRASAFSPQQTARNCDVKAQMEGGSTTDFVKLAPHTRRSFFLGIGALTGIVGFQQSALSIPMVTVDELGIIMRDSPFSIQVVEFSGPKSETVTVRLVDGTSFGLKDIFESATDPRSPLKVAAACRENNVKTRFVDLESVLAKAPKKKKLYTNQRVQDAQEKEKEKQERIRRDEEERLAALRRMEMEEEEALAAK